MQLLNDENDQQHYEAVAAAVVETIPLAMGTLRADLSRVLPDDLTLPQFRVLAYTSKHPGTSLSAIAEVLGLTISSISKIVDALVKRGDMRHSVCPTDRRQARLVLTEQGTATFEHYGALTQRRLAARLTALSAEECRAVIDALALIRRLCHTNTGAADRSPAEPPTPVSA